MNKIYLLLLALTLSACSKNETPSEVHRLSELDNYWAEVSRCVYEGDFNSYKATCHEDAVLVAGTSSKAHLLSDALVDWKPGFEATKSGKMKARVSFKFSQRLGDNNTAHETGMFLYSSEKADGIKSNEYIHFEALLIKRGSWKIMMEYQKSKGSEDEWNNMDKN